MKPLASTFQRGRSSEQRAVDFLVSQDFEILFRNDRRYSCEVDALAKRGDCLFLVEIKSRKTVSALDVAKSLGRAQTNRLKVAARKLWLDRKKFGCTRLKGILIVVSPDQVRVLSLPILTDSC
jgi:putative endonuclease